MGHGCRLFFTSAGDDERAGAGASGVETGPALLLLRWELALRFLAGAGVDEVRFAFDLLLVVCVARCHPSVVALASCSSENPWIYGAGADG